ncbi:putative mitochondrial mitochondrial ornithine transporter 1-like protein [Leptomonas pyrrhocoris]|uniref:Putative mitochondrial mitochondrial ornithine transporter 1-like protein n=1 Tax=Leptomonas pyrrhocoris TaxID=157538 RepID=A0A0M9FX69_LEPPY|nr:putative mitochondrial mitochondrial ornithine transporter 1-like protein [Leptomonas pyrrhocoris]KPA77789.1 putative mitochondrial mitochondrial ornithine transporter 1-like protein [Leptomonas pyrrhocoris]|eukprot:XP_015656228.1 putative mitochondrial mitochondrial ornithine transporter 1-like protein [Leptomonas pyrrhocoris]
MVDVLTHLMAGTLAGMTGVLVDYPLDTIKTRMQTRCPNTGGSYALCATRLYQQGGINAFYRGLSVPFVAQGAEAAIIFSVYHTALHHFRTEEEKGCSATDPLPPSIWSSLYYWKAAACAGLAVSFVLTPVEMVKCNLQMESSRPCWQRRHLSVRSLAWDVYLTDGLRGFYRGMTGTMTRAVFGNVAYFLSYEQCKQWLTCVSRPAARSSPLTSSSQHSTAKAPHHGVPAWRSMLAGGISGCLYWSIAYPADVAKTKMQVCANASAAGFVGTLRRCYVNGGVRALYRGWGVTAARAFLSSAVVFTTYERFERAIAGRGPVHLSLVREAASE